MCLTRCTYDDNAERYKELSPTFANSRECELLTKVVAAFKEGDIDEFKQGCWEFDQVSTLDAWTSSILLKIQKKMEAEPEWT